MFEKYRRGLRSELDLRVPKQSEVDYYALEGVFHDLEWPLDDPEGWVRSWA